MPGNSDRRATLAQLALALAVLTPVMVLPFLLQPATPTRFLLSVASGVAGLVYVSTMRRDTPMARHQTVALAVLTISVIIATLNADDFRLAAVGDPQRRLGLLTWLMAGLVMLTARSYFARTRDATRFLSAIASLSLVQFPFVLLQSLGRDPFGLMGTSPRAVGTLGNAAFLAELSLITAVIAGALRRDGSQRRASLLGICEAASWCNLVLSGTRSSLAIAVLALIILAKTGTVRPTSTSFPVRLRSLTAPIIGTAVGATLTAGKLSEFFGRSRGAFSTGLGRIDTWKLTLEVIADRPLFGWGDEHFLAAFPAHITPDWERTYSRARLPDRAHNLFLDFTVAHGIIGFVALFACIALGVRHCWRNRAAWQVADRRPALLATTLTTACVLLNEQFLFPTVDTLVMIAAIAGTAVGLCASDAVSENAQPNLARWITPSAIAMGIACLIAPVNAIRSDIAARAALQPTSTPDRAMLELTRASELTPESGVYQVYSIGLAVGAKRIDLIEQADALIDSAIARHPTNPYLWIQSARLNLDLASQLRGCDPVVDAIGALDRAAPLDPNGAERLFLTGNAHRLLGDDARAIESWEAADALFGRFDSARTNIDFAKQNPSSRFIAPCADGDAAIPPIGSLVYPGEDRSTRTDPRLGVLPFSVTFDASISEAETAQRWNEMRTTLEDTRFTPLKWTRSSEGRVAMTVSFTTAENLRVACDTAPVVVPGSCRVGRVFAIDASTWNDTPAPFPDATSWHAYLLSSFTSQALRDRGTGCEITTRANTTDLSRCAQTPWKWND